jgi:hypothetical protein
MPEEREPRQCKTCGHRFEDYEVLVYDRRTGDEYCIGHQPRPRVWVHALRAAKITSGEGPANDLRPPPALADPRRRGSLNFPA